MWLGDGTFCRCCSAADAVAGIWVELSSLEGFNWNVPLHSLSSWYFLGREFQIYVGLVVIENILLPNTYGL